MGMQSMQEALYNHCYRASVKGALQDGIAAAPVLRMVMLKISSRALQDSIAAAPVLRMVMLKISSHPIGGFISFSPARWSLVLLNKDAQKAKSSFLSKEQGG